MFFSVIVPVYNIEKYLKNCIESVLCQSFGDFELILVDDGSTDNCPVILDKFKEIDSRIKVIHKDNGGLASARHAGIKEATGEYVFNLDGDDAIEKDALNIAHKIICEYNCDIISFSYKWVKGSVTLNVTTDEIDEGYYDRERIEKEIYPKLLMDKNMKHVSYYLSGKAVRRELLTRNQLNVSTDISLGEDLCCVFPCYLQADSVYISKEEIYLYTIREDSLSKEFNTNQIFLIENVIEQLKACEFEKPKDFKEQIYRYSAFMCFAILAAAAENNYFNSITSLKNNIFNSAHLDNIKQAEFDKITFKSSIGIFLMKRGRIKEAFYFLNFCKKIKNLLGRG